MIIYSIFFIFSFTAIALVAWVVYRRSPIRALYAMTILLSIFYWYVLPGTLFIAGLAAGREDLYLLGDRDAVATAIAVVLLSLALLLIVPSLIANIPLADGGISQKAFYIIKYIVIGNVIAAALSFSISFQQYGFDVMLNLLKAEETARNLMSYQNFSSNFGQSLSALLEITVTFTSLFCLALLTITGQVNSMNFLLSFLSVVLLLISTGTRSILLMAIFATAIGFFLKRTYQLKAQSGIGKIFSKIPLIALNIGVAFLSFLTIIARFNDTSVSDDVWFSSISSHNDMFRELVFVISGAGNHPTDIIAFILTPVSFAMPSFLGFNKSIPLHLIDFNLRRADIDLVGGEGNVFPGLLGDAYMLTDAFAPLFVFGLIGCILLLFNRAALKGRSDQIAIALLIALLSYFFISVRNLQGSLLIVSAFAVGFRVLFNRLDAKMKRLSARTPFGRDIRGRK